MESINLRERALNCKRRMLEHDPHTDAGVAAISNLLDEWLEEISAVPMATKANRWRSSDAWSETQDLFSRGWLQNRARMKPRGYAGDYELFARICDGTISDDPWGRAFDQYFQRQDAARAVRERTKFVGKQIVQMVREHSGPFKFASIGSGPARDILAACQQLTPAQRAQLEVILVDIDPAALDYAAKALAPYLSPAQIRLERQNLLRLPESTSLAKVLEGTSLISCTGLLDYLDDEQVIRMLGYFHSVLAAKGRGLAFHFSISNTTRAYMEWVADWYLNYRTADEFFSLGKAAKIPVDWPIDSLVEGTALFLDWSKR
jgi:hypothetical protein